MAGDDGQRLEPQGRGNGRGLEDGLRAASLLRAENVRSVLAYVIVVGQLGFVIAMTAWRGIETGERVAAVSTGILGAVVGFYFGRQGFERALGQATAAERARGLAEGSATELQEALADSAREYEALFAAYKRLVGQHGLARNVKKEIRA
jgi:hypothetical protein